MIARATRVMKRVQEGYLTPKRILNRLAVDLHERLKSDVILAYPDFLIVETINGCNSTCKLCPVGEGRKARPVQVLDMEIYKAFIDELGPYAQSIILQNWGEPLLDKYLAERIAYADRKGLMTGISTNLQNLNDVRADELVRSGLKLVYVSLHAANQESYEAYQPGRDFRKVVDNIRKLVAARRRNGSRFPRIEALLVRSRKNEQDVAKMHSLARELGIDGCVIGSISLNGRFLWSKLDMSDRRLTEEQFRRELLQRAEEWLPREEFARLDPQLPAPKKQKTCDRLWRAAVLNSDGTIAPCCDVFRPENDFGTYRIGARFRDVWNNDLFRAARRSFSKPLASDPITVCSACPGHDSMEKWRNPVRF